MPMQASKLALPLRLAASISGGLLVAVILTWTMQRLVLHEAEINHIARQHPVMEFVRLQRESQTSPKQRTLPDKPPPSPESQPAMPRLAQLSQARISAHAPAIAATIPSIPMHIASPFIGPVEQGTPDHDFIALTRLAPQYPYRAERKGIEGWVKLSFEITASGEVSDVVVIDASPRGVFDQAAIRAIAKWKFKPRIQDGKAVAVRTQQTIDFRLRKGSK